MLSYGIYNNIFEKYTVIHACKADKAQACNFPGIPGGPGIQNAAGAWIKTLLTKSLSIIIIAMFIILVSKFNLTDFFAENLLTDIVLPTRCIQNMFIMMLTAAGVKGADSFMKQTFGI